MKLKCRFQVQGRVTFYELLPGLRRGRKMFEGKNIITTLGRQKVAALITGESTAFVTKMAIGDGGAPQTDLLTPIIPVLSNVSLVNELERSPVTASRVGQTLTFLATFLTASVMDPQFINPANKVYNEAGLFTADNVLFARKTFPSAPFSPMDRVGVVGQWDIEIL